MATIAHPAHVSVFDDTNNLILTIATVLLVGFLAIMFFVYALPLLRGTAYQSPAPTNPNSTVPSVNVEVPRSGAEISLPPPSSY